MTLNMDKLRLYKELYLPKNRFLKVVYIGLWFFDPVFMAIVLSVQIVLVRRRKIRMKK